MLRMIMQDLIGSTGGISDGSVLKSKVVDECPDVVSSAKLLAEAIPLIVSHAQVYIS